MHVRRAKHKHHTQQSQMQIRMTEWSMCVLTVQEPIRPVLQRVSLEVRPQQRQEVLQQARVIAMVEAVPVQLRQPPQDIGVSAGGVRAIDGRPRAGGEGGYHVECRPAKEGTPV